MCCFHQQNFSFPATLTGTCRSVFPYKYRCNVSSDIVSKQKTADTLFSTASLGSVRTGIGLVASIPLRGIAGVFALSSAAMVGASKKIQCKISKHQGNESLAVAKHDKVEQMM